MLVMLQSMLEEDQGWLSSAPLDVEYATTEQSDSRLNIQHNPYIDYSRTGNRARSVPCRSCVRKPH